MTRGIRSVTRHARLVVALAAVGVAVGVGTPSAVSAATANFENPSTIAAPDSPALAAPYPSAIDVTGVAGSIQDVDVTLRRLQHTCERDLSILLVGPEGEQTILMSSSGSCPGEEGPFDETLTFDQEAAASLPCTEGLPVSSGAYRPARNACFPITEPSPEEFPAPAPSGPYPVTLAGFYGKDANGQWQLFVRDESVGDVGKVAEGWSLAITPAEPPAPPSNAFSFGRLKRNKVEGTATLIIRVPGPGSLVLIGGGLTTQWSTASAAGAVKLRIKPKGKKKAKLTRTGSVKLKARVSYTPVGGAANAETKAIKLVKRP